MGNEIIPIVSSTSGKPSTAGTPARAIPVHAATTTIIPPASEVILQCCIQDTDTTYSTLLSDGSVLTPEGIMVAPAVSQ
ncbi:hypothetical protein V3C99_009610 [Haemonchus contortus]